MDTDNDWLLVSNNAFNTCGIRQPGTLWCWGRNDQGELGRAYDPSPTLVPSRVGNRNDWVEVVNSWMHTCARRADGTIWCTGENDSGQVGDGTTVRPYAFVAVNPFP
jgi:alpha-tubulin suppressor-like RCC1 family protein